MSSKEDSNPVIFPELETDINAIEKFVKAENTRTLEAFTDAAFEEDVRIALTLIESPDQLNGLTRRGDWLYTFRQTKENPRGLWLRVQQDFPLGPETDWEIVFDLDSYSNETGSIWQWCGAITPVFSSSRVLLCLSAGGSDQISYLEFDCDTNSFVPDGFKIPPSRSEVEWLTPDCLLWGDAQEGSATNSGWSGQIRKLHRGMKLLDAPVIYRAAPDDLLVRAYVLRDRDAAQDVTFISRYSAIGKEQVIRLLPEQPDYILPAPPDTEVHNSASHFAYVAKEQGGEPGTLHVGCIGNDKTRVVFTPSPRVVVDANSILVMQDWLLYVVLDNLRPGLFALNLNDPDAVPQQIALPETAENLWVRFHDANFGSDDGTLQLYIHGFLCSPRIYLFDLKKGIGGIKWHKIWQNPEAFDATGMRVELHEATSDDGTKIPYNLILPKTYTEGDVPVLLHGYGGFGISMLPYYSKLYGALWLSRGGAYAMAHIRGGAEFGPNWHQQAKGAGRVKSYQDFAAIAADMVKRGISTPKRIACHGGSNGGLLCGVMLTRYPDRFGAVWASVGVYDMLRYHNFPAGKGWIDEYGDPEDLKAREWLLAYSPIHHVRNVKQITYPPALIDTSSTDDRVDPSHSRRFVAEMKKQGHTPWFIEYGDGGHGGGGSSIAEAKEQALGFRFLHHALKAG